MCPNSVLSLPLSVSVEGDWSNGAYFLCAGALCELSKITCKNLRTESLQGDKAVIDILKRFGAKVNVIDNGNIEVCAPDGGINSLVCTEIDASQIPDIIPPLSVVAALAKGTTRIYNASRLRLKESDRLSAIAETLLSLGADVKEGEDFLEFTGVNCLTGGVVNSHNDHRIAMMAAIAALVSVKPVIIEDAAAVNKSYPGFYETLRELGLCIS